RQDLTLPQEQNLPNGFARLSAAALGIAAVLGERTLRTVAARIADATVAVLGGTDRRRAFASAFAAGPQQTRRTVGHDDAADQFGALFAFGSGIREVG